MLILMQISNHLTCHSIILKYIKNISNKLAINGKLTIALPSESSIRSLDNKIRITEYKGRLVIQLSIDQSKDWYAMLSFDQTGLSYIKNDSDGYVSKKIV